VFVHDRVTRETRRVSVSSNGFQANDSCRAESISADGRYATFTTAASTLVTNDTNAVEDVFVHDLVTGETLRVSVDSQGGQGDGRSQYSSISADGRLVAFLSEASNLVPDDTNHASDVFVHDLATGETTRVSVLSDGSQSLGGCGLVSISADGRYVAFESFAHLVWDDTDYWQDIFVHDRQTGQTTRASVDSRGHQVIGDSHVPTISADGRYVAFSSLSSDFVDDDYDSNSDVFVHDMLTGVNTRASVNSQGDAANQGSREPHLSPDGRYVSFTSSASDMVSDDTNDLVDAFLHDLQTGETTRVSLSSDGEQANSYSYSHAVATRAQCVLFESVGNLVEDDHNHVTDVYVRDRPSLDFNGTAQYPNAVNFTAIHANASQTGKLAVVFLSCSGTEPNVLPGGRTIYLTFDVCTVLGFNFLPLLSGTIDATGTANTPAFTFPDIAPGVTIYGAAVIYDPTTGRFDWATDPIWFTSQ
jgi:Tol biopolymer transport system component